VIAGKSLLAFKRDQGGKQELSGRCFAWVQTYDEKPKRRLFELLQSQAMQPNQQVDFLSDGGEDVRNVQLYLNPQAEHLVDFRRVGDQSNRKQTDGEETTDGRSQRGAHLLLQIRTRVLDGEWENTFRRWYPDFRPDGQQAKKAA
jgi:hypothetical protein